MKIVEMKDHNERLKNIMTKMHSLGEEAVKQFWDSIVPELNKFTPMTGDEALSALSTLIADFTCRFIFLMKAQIADQDDTGYSLDYIKNAVLDGFQYMLDQTYQINKKSVPQNIGEIKRI